MRLRVLGVVPARGGSKGIDRKNVRLLCGKPLLHYTAEAAHAAARLSRVILTTDDEQVAECGARCGLEVPFLRPATLAADDTPMLPVIEHVLQWADDAQPAMGRRLRAAADVAAAPAGRHRRVRLAPRSRRTSTRRSRSSRFRRSTTRAGSTGARRKACCASRPGELTPVTRRQDLRPAYHRDGAVYAVRASVVKNKQSLYGDRVAACLTDPSRAVNIDTLEDWRLAERWLRRYGNRPTLQEGVGARTRHSS